MNTLGINMTDNELTKGWADIKPAHHPVNTLYALSLSAWKLASKMADEGRDWSEIKRMQDAAIELEKLSINDDECTCFLPEQSCNVCRTMARVIYEEET